MANNNPEPIDLRIIAQKLWSNRKYFYKTLPIAFVLSCLYILSYPRYYTSDVRLAPELGSSMGGGTLGDIASSLGFDISEMQTNDAISLAKKIYLKSHTKKFLIQITKQKN